MNYTNTGRTISLLLLIVLLTGCLSPQAGLKGDQPPNEEQLNSIQVAIEKYSEETNGLLPIRTKDNETPTFEKYLLDFDKLKELNLISELPSNSYERGGIYQYSLITPEENPEVKVIDLRVTDELQKIYTKLDIYRSKHTYPPYGEQIEDGVFEINYEELGLKSRPFVVSPFSNENLPIIMDINGEIYVDYRSDLYEALNEYEHTYRAGDDIRYLLTDHYPFAPAHSLPYTIRDGEPVIKSN